MEEIQIIDFSKLKKKNKLSDMQAMDFSIKKPIDQDKISEQKLPKQQNLEEAKTEQQISPNSDPHSYDALLSRIYGMLKANNPELGEKKKLIMKPPQLVRMAGRRIAWTNFIETCEKLNRLPDHLCAFILTELGAEGSIDEGKLIVKKRQVTNKDMQSLLLKYIAEYVTCSVCKGTETELVRDNSTRLNFMKCNSCKVDSRSVAQIRGYHTQSGRR